MRDELPPGFGAYDPFLNDPDPPDPKQYKFPTVALWAVIVVVELAVLAAVIDAFAPFMKG